MNDCCDLGTVATHIIWAIVAIGLLVARHYYPALTRFLPALPEPPHGRALPSDHPVRQAVRDELWLLFPWLKPSPVPIAPGDDPTDDAPDAPHGPLTPTSTGPSSPSVPPQV